jgi:nicotinamidase-related amidase
MTGTALLIIDMQNDTVHPDGAYADRGYAVTVVSDATSSLSDDWQQAALGYALTNIATISTTAEAAALFGN